MRRPNNFQTKSDFLLNLVHSLYKRGNAYAYLDDYVDGAPTAMYLLNAGVTRGYRDRESGEVFYSVADTDWYKVERLDQTVLVPARRIVNIRLHTPYDPLLGVSPIQAVAASIAANNAILGHEAMFFTNMSRPSGVLSTDQTLSKEQILTLRAAWNAQSSSLNSGGVPILANGLKWAPMSITSQDSQLVAALKMSILDISRAFRVPPQIINAGENTPISNVEALINWWLASGLGFLLDHIELAFAKAFNLPTDEQFNLNTDVLLRSDMQARITSLGEAVMKGIYSPNEARSRENLPSVEYGDEPRVQQQVVPLSYYSVLLEEKLAALEADSAKQADNQPTPEDPEDPEDPEEPDAPPTENDYFDLIKRAVARSRT
jgi:HK97 family phage portal protein